MNTVAYIQILYKYIVVKDTYKVGPTIAYCKSLWNQNWPYLLCLPKLIVLWWAIHTCKSIHTHKKKIWLR